MGWVVPDWEKGGEMGFLSLEQSYSIDPVYAA